MSLLQSLHSTSLPNDNLAKSPPPIQPNAIIKAKYPDYLCDYDSTNNFQSRGEYTNLFINPNTLLINYQSLLSAHPNYLRFNSHPNDINKSTQNNNNNSDKDNKEVGSGILSLIQIKEDLEIAVDKVFFSDLNLDGSCLAVVGDADGKVRFFKVEIKESEIEVDNYTVGIIRSKISSCVFIKCQTEGFQGLENLAVVMSLQNGDLVKWDVNDARIVTSQSLSMEIVSLQAVGNNDSHILVRGLIKTWLLKSDTLEFLIDITKYSGYSKVFSLPVGDHTVDKMPLFFMAEDGRVAIGTIDLNAVNGSIGIDDHIMDTIINIKYYLHLKDFMAIGCDFMSFPSKESEDVLYEEANDYLLVIYSKEEYLILKTEDFNKITPISSIIRFKSDSKKENSKIANIIFLNNKYLMICDLFNIPFLYKINKDGNIDHKNDLLNKSIQSPLYNDILCVIQPKNKILNSSFILNIKVQQNKLVFEGCHLESMIEDDKMESITGEYSNNNIEKGQSQLVSTFMTPVTLGKESCISDWLAKGYEDGRILLSPLYKLFDQLISSKDNNNNDDDKYEIENETTKWLIGHTAPITWLLEPAPSRLNTKLFLLSGDAIGMVKLWELSTGVCLATFNCHNCGVIKMFQLPLPRAEKSKKEEPKSKMDRLRISQLVFTIGSNYSIAVLDLKRMICLGKIENSLSPIYKVVYYSLPYSGFMVVYNNGSFSNWKIEADSICREKNQTVLDKFQFPFQLNENVWDCGILLNDKISKNLKTTTSIFSYTINSITKEYPLLRVFEIDLRKLAHDVNNDTTPSIRFFTGITLIYPNLKENLDRKNKMLGYSSASILRQDKANFLDNNQQQEEKINIAEHLMKFIYSYLTFSTNQMVFNNFLEEEKLNQYGNNPCLRLVIKGPNDTLSFLNCKSVYCSNHDDKRIWTTSPYYTSIRLLPILSMAKFVLSKDGSESKIIEVITNYGSLLKESIGDRFQFPSLEYLIEYWADIDIEIQHAARSLFLSSFIQLSSETKFQILFYYESFLPEILPEDLIYSKNAISATLVLATILSEHPTLIDNSHSRQLISQALEWILSYHTNLNYRKIAVNILTRSFSQFEPYVDGIFILRCVYEMINNPSNTLREAAYQAILQIAISNPILLISSFGLTKEIEELKSILKLIPYFIKKKKSLLFDYIAPTVEVILKALSPKELDRSQHLLPLATQAIHDLVTNYGMVDFHSETQRLAVGLREGAAIIYDVRTCTRYLVLEGYMTPITSLCFSPDGKLLATFSLMEQVLKVWHTSAGLFSMLTKSLRSVTPNQLSNFGGNGREDSRYNHSPPSLASMFSMENERLKSSSVSAPTSGRSSPFNTLPAGFQPTNMKNANSNTLMPPPSVTSGFLSTSPAPYRTFNVKMEEEEQCPISPTTIMQSAELMFTGPRSIKLMINGLELCFNI